MKRNFRFLMAATLAGVLAAGAGKALAYGGCGGPGGRGGFGPVGAAYRLDDLTAEQRKQLDSLREMARVHQAQMREDRQALDDAVSAGADAQTLRPLAEKHGKNVAEAALRRAEMQAAVNEILTDAQRKELDEMRSAATSGRGNGRGMGW